MKSDLVIKFGDKILTEKMDLIEAPDFGVLPSVTHDLTDIRVGIGQRVVNSKIGPKYFSLKFVMHTSKWTEDRDWLVSELQDLKEKRLDISFYADRYWMAVIDGDSSFIRPMESRLEIEVELSFLVPSGRAIATTLRPKEAALNKDGIMEAEIINNGTTDAVVSYEITMKHENGYVGIVSEYGAIELGKAEEADGEFIYPSEVLYNSDEKANFNDWVDDNGTNIQNPSNTANGKLEENSYAGKKIITLKTAGSGPVLHGGMKRITFKVDSEGKTGSKNWYCYLEEVFHAFIGGQTGAITLCFFDKNQKDVVSFVIYKTDMNGQRANVNMSANGKFLKEVPFDCSGNAINPFLTSKGYMDITKEGEKVTFFFLGERFSFVENAIKDMEVVGCQLFIGQYRNRSSLNNDYISHLFFRKMIFQKNAVEKWRDIPNRYPLGTKIWVDGDKKRPYVNDLLALQDEVVGTNYFRVPPGTTKVQFFYSSFSDPPPSITAYLQEAYL